MNRQLHRAALVLALAGQSIVAPVARLSCDYVRPVTVALQRVSSALPTSPRWGHVTDRAGAASRNTPFSTHGG
jgi:hypothetical protein